MDRLINFFTIVIVTVLIFPVLTGADAYFLKIGILPPYPSLLLLLAIFTPILYRSLIKSRGRDLLRVYYNTRWISVPLGILAVFSLVWGLHPGANWDENGRAIFYEPYHWFLLLLSIGVTSSGTIRKHYRLIFIMMFLGASASIWWDMSFPGFFSKLTTRAAGFYTDANAGAMSIVILAIASINWEKPDSLNWLLLILVPIFLYPTLSVGSISLFVIILFIYLFLSFKGKVNVMKSLTWITVSALLVLFVAKPIFMEMASTNTMFEEKVSKERVDDIVKMGQGDLAFAQDHDRLNLVIQYWNIFIDAPLFGHGTGFIHTPEATRTLGPHNMFLRYGVEYGLLGLALYLLLLGGAFYHFWTLNSRRGMVLVLAFVHYSFLDHNLLLHKTPLITFGVLATLAYLEKVKSHPIRTPGRKLAPQ